MVARRAADLAAATERAREVADDVLFPRAGETDRAPLVPRRNLEALRSAGLFGLFAPLDVSGGLGAGHAEARPVLEAVAGGCGATAFVWAQHHGAVRRIAGGEGPARETWLPRVCDGSTLAGIGFAYLRRPGPPAVRATRVAGGWRLDGRAPWITGWGLIEALVVMARADDRSVVTVVVDRPEAQPSLRPGEPQSLAVMGATGTVALAFEGLVCADDDVVGVQRDGEWRRRDRLGSAMPPPAPLGIADRAIRLLRERQEFPGVPPAVASLDASLAARRERTDAVAARVSRSLASVDEPIEDAVAEGAVERDRGLDLARRSTDALVAASGGGAMALEHPAQRLSREAGFYLIQAQTGELRAASLARMTAP